ncbi:MAG TPA: PHP domain-containing protein, partial [Thermomicrobiales bacterium]|nr:PHP domain-containing protein [Thermomicrobiales bacterium]
MAYVHLHAHSCFSFLDGCAQPEELAAAAAGLGQGALALTDWAGLYAAPAFDRACRAAGVRPIFGAEVAVPGLGHLTLLVKDGEGWRALCRLLTAAQLAG